MEFEEGEPLLVPTDAHWRTWDREVAGWDRQRVRRLGLEGGAARRARSASPPWGVVGGSNHRRLASRMLRREFRVGKEVRRATAYVCGLGFFDLHLNGRLVGDQLMNPALTGYDRRACYVTFDVTRDVRPGANAVGVVLGNGRYFAPRRDVPVPMHNYGYPKLLLQLRLEYTDGSVENVVSDADWRLTTDGPIRGEQRVRRRGVRRPPGDAGVVVPGLRRFGLAAGGPGRAPRRGARSADDRADPHHRGPEAGRRHQPQAGHLPGRLRPGVLRVGPAQGLRQGRDAGPDSHVVQRDARRDSSTPPTTAAPSTSTSTPLRATGVETWRPRFKANATRYAQVEGYPGVPTADHFEGLVTHTDMEPVGQFACSNPLINRIYRNARWGTRMQNRSVPMEPDRDERMPWSGHPAKTSESEGYAFNVARFYDHFLHNYRAHQAEDGSLQEILPPYWTFNSRDIIWPSVVTVIPDWYYNFYGDPRPLADNFECMKRWTLFHQKAYLKPDFTIDYCNYGDWVDGSWIKGTSRQADDLPPLDVDGLLLQQLPDRRPRRPAAGEGRGRQAIRRAGGQGESRLQRAVLRPEGEHIRERRPRGRTSSPWPSAWSPRGTATPSSPTSSTRSGSGTKGTRRSAWSVCSGSCRC